MCNIRLKDAWSRIVGENGVNLRIALCRVLEELRLDTGLVVFDAQYTLSTGAFFYLTHFCSNQFFV